MKIGKDEIMYMRALESIAGVSARDCIVGDSSITFIVDSGKAGAVIGKNGVTIKKMRQTMKQNIEVFEYAKTPKEFLAKALHNIKIGEIRNNNGSMDVKLDAENRKILMLNTGRLKKIREIMKRSYGIENLRIR